MRTLEGIFALGRKIADDIGANEEPNTTGKWIAHHLAEKLEKAKGDPKSSGECVELILQLWAARRYFPSGNPFERYDKILPFMEGLAGIDTRFHYHLSGREERPTDLEPWLNLAESVDQISSSVIALCIKEGVSAEGIQDDKWLELANGISSDSEVVLLWKLREFLPEAEIEGAEPNDRNPILTKIEELRETLNDLEAKLSDE